MNGYANAYVRYLVYFHVQRDYFECHEVLEEYWKQHPEDPHASSYVVLIQIAVASYHQRRGNLKGALKMFASAHRRLESLDLGPLGIDGEQLAGLLHERIKVLEQADRQAPVFTDLQLPILDPKLRQLCELASPDGSLWGRPSDLNDGYLLNKHTLRDRSPVIQERDRQKRSRDISRTIGGNASGQA